MKKGDKKGLSTIIATLLIILLILIAIGIIWVVIRKVIIQGSVGDICGYAMRGGALYIKRNVGYRCGIHMKEYKGNHPYRNPYHRKQPDDRRSARGCGAERSGIQGPLPGDARRRSALSERCHAGGAAPFRRRDLLRK